MDKIAETFADIEDNPILKIVMNAVADSFPKINLSLALAPLNPIVTVVLLFLLVSALLLAILTILRRVLTVYLHLQQSFTILEVKPPQETLQSSYTTQQLFNLIHGLAKQRSWFQRLLANQKSYAFEIVSTKDEGIRYLLRVNEEDADLIKKGLLSYLPGIHVVETKDYVPSVLSEDTTSVAHFSLSNHFAFPLKKQDELNEHDPIAYMTGNMTKLAPDELVSFQLVVSPLNKSSIGDIKRISHLIYTNKDLVKGLHDSNAGGLFLAVIRLVLLGFFYLITLPLGILVFIATDGREGPLLPLPFGQEKAKTPNPYQAELELMVKGKLDQPLFSSSMRLLVIANKPTTHKRVRGFLSSLSSFNNSYQSIYKSRSIASSYFEQFNKFLFEKRLLNFYSNTILSISEVADLYHFPFTTTTRTEDIQKIHSKELPAPVSLKKATNLDVTFAKNSYGGSTTMIGLTEEERRRHVYILGATGTGKTTLLLSMINQDIQRGKGVCLIDPHGDLAESLLPLIPKDRIKDVIYFNPDDSENPIALNLLELPNSPDATEAEKLRDQEFITESIISLFNKLYPDHTARPRMEYILRNTIYTAFLTPNPTIFTILKLLVDAPFRRTVVKKLATLPDKNLYNFWKYEFNKAGDYQKVSMIMPITNKIGRFQFSPTARGILEQEKSKIDFENIMDSGKILICNVSKGRLGEDISEMFGILLLTKIQLAALRRAKKKIADRKDFYLYVDEFQNFATPAFAQILSEARKYRLNAILAHQTVSQIEDRSLVNVTLANAGTVLCFRTANPLDEELMLPQFAPHIDPGEISNLPSYHFFMKVSAIEPQMPFSGETLPVKIPDDQGKVNQIIESSRSLYATHLTAETALTKQAKTTLQELKPVAKPTSRAKRKLH